MSGVPSSHSVVWTYKQQEKKLMYIRTLKDWAREDKVRHARKGGYPVISEIKETVDKESVGMDNEPAEGHYFPLVRH